MIIDHYKLIAAVTDLPLMTFQFPVNTDPPVTVSLLETWPLVLFAAVLLAAIVVGYSAWVWRLALAERAAAEAGEADDASAGA